MGTIAAVRLRVLAQAGIAVLPEYFVRKDLAARRLVRLLPRRPLAHDTFRLVWRRDHPHGTALVQLARELAEIPLK